MLLWCLCQPWSSFFILFQNTQKRTKALYVILAHYIGGIVDNYIQEGGTLDILVSGIISTCDVDKTYNSILNIH